MSLNICLSFGKVVRRHKAFKMTKEELTKLLEFVRAMIYDKDKAAEMIRKMEAMEIDN